MSRFKSKGIVLKINKIVGSEYLYTIFSHDYGKIQCSKSLSKKEKNLDLWYMINFEILTKQEAKIHKIQNIIILREFNTQNQSFAVINTYLEFLAYINTSCAPNLQIIQIYGIFEALYSLSEISNEKILLSWLKSKQIFWLLQIEDSDNTTQKILKFIHKNNISNILKLTGINEKIYQKLQWYL